MIIAYVTFSLGVVILMLALLFAWHTSAVKDGRTYGKMFWSGLVLATLSAQYIWG